MGEGSLIIGHILLLRDSALQLPGLEEAAHVVDVPELHFRLCLVFISDLFVRCVTEGFFWSCLRWVFLSIGGEEGEKKKEELKKN